MTPGPTPEVDYRRLLQMRSTLRGFLRWSEEQAQVQGLTAAQHQLLLAIKGHPSELAPSVGEIAAHLGLRHHSAVGLIDRAQSAGLVARTADAEHPGTVRLALTPLGEERIAALSELHQQELVRLAPVVEDLLRGLDAARR